MVCLKYQREILHTLVLQLPSGLQLVPSVEFLAFLILVLELPSVNQFTLALCLRIASSKASFSTRVA